MRYITIIVLVDVSIAMESSYCIVCKQCINGAFSIAILVYWIVSPNGKRKHWMLIPAENGQQNGFVQKSPVVDDHGPG